MVYLYIHKKIWVRTLVTYYITWAVKRYSGFSALNYLVLGHFDLAIMVHKVRYIVYNRAMALDSSQNFVNILITKSNFTFFTAEYKNIYTRFNQIKNYAKLLTFAKK